eukprot:290359-Amphidinium_carterae.1
MPLRRCGGCRGQSAVGQCAGYRFSQWYAPAYATCSVPWARQGRHRRDGQAKRRPHGPAKEAYWRAT